MTGGHHSATIAAMEMGVEVERELIAELRDIQRALIWLDEQTTKRLDRRRELLIHLHDRCCYTWTQLATQIGLEESAVRHTIRRARLTKIRQPDFNLYDDSMVDPVMADTLTSHVYPAAIAASGAPE